VTVLSLSIYAFAAGFKPGNAERTAQTESSAFTAEGPAGELPELGGEAPEMNGQFPEGEAPADLPEMNGEAPEMNGNLPEMNGQFQNGEVPTDLPEMNGEAPEMNGNFPEMNGQFPEGEAPADLPEMNGQAPDMNGTPPEMSGQFPGAGIVFTDFDALAEKGVISEETLEKIKAYMAENAPEDMQSMPEGQVPDGQFQNGSAPADLPEMNGQTPGSAPTGLPEMNGEGFGMDGEMPADGLLADLLEAGVITAAEYKAITEAVAAE